MENFQEFEPDQDKIEDNKILEMVLMEPKKAFVFINKYQYEKHLKILLVLAGIASAFERAVRNNSGDKQSLGEIIGFSIFFGGLLGWISYYIFAALISFTGKWINGKATIQEIIRVMAYALIPSVLSLIIYVILIAYFGVYYFQSFIDTSNTFDYVLMIGLSIIQIFLSIWTLILLAIGVAETQKFSIGKGFLNILLPIFIFLALIGIVFLISTAI